MSALSRREVLAAGAVSLFAITPARAETRKVRLAFAPPSVIQVALKGSRFLEDDLKPLGVEVEWIPTTTSTQGWEYLRGGSADFAGAGGSAALQGRANGNPLQVVYFISHGELIALVTLPNSGINSPADLKGKRVAAAPGTEPYYFLLRGLASAGLTEKDITLVPLPHPDGAAALDTGQVDAWAGLDPWMARIELRKGAKRFWRNPDILTGSVLATRDAFAKENPDLLAVVLRSHEKIRKWVVANPDKTAELAAKISNTTNEEAKLALSRLDFEHPAVEPSDFRKIGEYGETLKYTRDIPRNTDVDATLKTLLRPEYLQQALAGADK